MNEWNGWMATCLFFFYFERCICYDTHGFRRFLMYDTYTYLVNDEEAVS